MIEEVRLTDAARVERLSLPISDRVALDRYLLALISGDGPVQVDKYEDDMFRVRHIKSAYQGRALFTVRGRVAHVVLIYKKEGDRVPSRILSAARNRVRDIT